MTDKRYQVLDHLRGIMLLNMIAYHGMWDLIYLFDQDFSWYSSYGSYVWQQSICWSFILISGFCWSLSRKKVKRGMMTLGSGVLITLVTLSVMPENRVVFGILTLLGSCMLFMIPLEKILKRCPAYVGGSISGMLFVLSRNINAGYLGFANWEFMQLPKQLYHNLLTTYLGFPMPSFYSTDYFSIFPWSFLFITGYFLYRILDEKKWLRYLEGKSMPKLEWIGRHSLMIYFVHQPILFVGFTMIY